MAAGSSVGQFRDNGVIAPAVRCLLLHESEPCGRLDVPCASAGSRQPHATYAYGQPFTQTGLTSWRRTPTLGGEYHRHPVPAVRIFHRVGGDYTAAGTPLAARDPGRAAFGDQVVRALKTRPCAQRANGDARHVHSSRHGAKAKHLAGSAWGGGLVDFNYRAVCSAFRTLRKKIATAIPAAMPVRSRAADSGGIWPDGKRRFLRPGGAGQTAETNGFQFAAKQSIPAGCSPPCSAGYGYNINVQRAVCVGRRGCRPEYIEGGSWKSVVWFRRTDGQI